MDENDNQLEKLYLEFRDQLESNPDSLYVDEQDLVDIFDYAGDVHDDYVRMEAMLLAARLFPQSDLLLKRRAIWLAGIDETSFKTFVKNNCPQKRDALWYILSCRCTFLDKDEAETTLNHIISTYRFDDDETIIQFVALVRFWQMEEWLVDSLAMVRRRCEYEPTLLFEIARMAESNAQVEVAIKLLEELTLIDPFNPDYWSLLAELQTNSSRFDEALTSLDYAKALTPDDAELLTLEGYIVLKQGDADKAVGILRRALDLSPEQYPARRDLLEALITAGKSKEVGPFAFELFVKDPADSSLLNTVLIYYPQMAEDALARHYSAVGPDEASAIQRAGELCQEGCADMSLRLLQWYQRTYSLSQTGLFALLEMLYINERYNEAYDFMIEHLKSPVLKPHELPIVGIIASTLVKLGLYDDAREFSEKWMAKLTESTQRHNAYRLINRGVVETLADIHRILSAPGDPDLDALDAAIL